MKRRIFHSHYISDSTDSLWEKDLNSVWKDWSQTLGHESDFVNILCFYWDELSIFKNNNNNKIGIHGLLLSTRILKEKVFPHLLEKKSKKVEIYFVSIWHISED